MRNKRPTKWATNRKRIWNQAVDGYLSRIDSLYENSSKPSSTLESLLPAPDSRHLVRLTIASLLIVFIIILCSCTVQHRRSPIPHLVPVGNPDSGYHKQPDTLYTRHEAIVIEQKMPGSATGSIWADTQPHWHLFADARPQRVGDVVTITVPDDLQYSAPPQAAAAPAGGGGAGAAQAQIPETEPALELEPVRELRMEVIAMEATGDVFLRGVRDFRNDRGQSRRVLVTAKVPRRELTGFSLDAKSLTGISLVEENNGATADYAATGWDKTVSRRLAGFVPDVSAEYAALEDVRKGLRDQQKALQDQAQALGTERERIAKDRERLQQETTSAAAALAATQAEMAQNQATGAALPPSAGESAATTTKTSAVAKKGASK